MSDEGTGIAQHDLEVVAWIIQRLYSGGSWMVMERDRPEINAVCERLDVWRDIDDV